MDVPTTPTAESLRLRMALRAKRHAICAVMQKYDAINPRVFGSVAHGTAGPQSDIDILVDEVRAPGLFSLTSLTRELEEITQTRVDLLIKDHIKPNRISLILESEMMYL